MLLGRNNCLPAAAESCKKGTLKVDLQALTVGVAVVSMGAWLASARTALLQDANATLDASRKLAVVNGLGEHSRAQVGASAQRTARGTALPVGVPCRRGDCSAASSGFAGQPGIQQIRACASVTKPGRLQSSVSVCQGGSRVQGAAVRCLGRIWRGTLNACYEA